MIIRLLPFLLILALWIYAFIDCLNTPENEVRKLPKVMWVIIILLFGQVLLGPIAWFAVGRPRRNAPYGATPARRAPLGRSRRQPRVPQVPGRAAPEGPRAGRVTLSRVLPVRSR
ncbi:PLD nuclease N-terminal domain-containing protein [Streptomyces albus]